MDNEKKYNEVDDIDPDTINLSGDVADDSEMPEPQTKTYQKYIVVASQTIDVLHECTNELPANTTLRSGNKEIKLLALLSFFEKKTMSEGDFAMCKEFFAALPIKNIRPFLEYLDNPQTHAYSVIER